MTIKAIDKRICESCSLRTGPGCPIMDSCSADVIRLDESGFPNTAYLDDCGTCYWCQDDCPNGAVNVTSIREEWVMRTPDKLDRS